MSARRRRLLAVGGSALTLAAITLASVSLGARDVGLSEIIAGLSDNADSLGALAVQERVPRTVLGLLAGAALGISGALMQAITRNPLADPGILGVNSGAALSVVIGIAFFGVSTTTGYLWLALAGAAVTAVFVYAVGSAGRGGATPIKLALAGAATAAALSSVVSAILLPRIDVMRVFRFWQVGGIGGASWDGISTVLPLFILGMLIACALTPALNALALGDDVATGLGVRVGQTRAAAAAGIALCGAATAVCGPIAFVGLMVPHVVRLLTGPDQRWIMPLSGAIGAAVLTLSDVVGRLIMRPGEVEAGIITAFIGAPVLIIIARRTRIRSL